MSIRVFAGTVGVVALALGLFFGLVHHSASADYVGSVSCGSAIFPDKSEAEHADRVSGLTNVMQGGPVGDYADAANACDKAVGSSTVAYIIIVAGVLILIGSAVVRPSRTA